MAGQCWPSPHQSQNKNPLQLVTMVSSSSAASSSMDTSSLLIQTDNKFPAVHQSADSRMASSTLYQALASNTIVSSSSSPSSGLSSARLSPQDFLKVQHQTAQPAVSTYGESLAKLASLHSKKQSSSSSLGAISFSSLSSMFAQQPVQSSTTLPVHTSSPTAVGVPTNGSIGEMSSALLQAASPQRQHQLQQQQQSFKPAAVSTIPASRPQAMIASTPVKGCSASTQASFVKAELCGSPLSSTGSQSCESSLDNFLSPSPYYCGDGNVAADSPSASSTYNVGSPDTTVDNAAADPAGDSGYSDHITTTTTTTDKSTSPQLNKADHHRENDVDTQRPGGTSSPSKRKRIRKSRAKQQQPQDPKVKTAVRRTRRVRANDRERTRMHGLNDAMDVLRKYLPNDGAAGKLTKIDTLRTAANYIRVLKMLLTEIDKGEDMSSWPSDMVAAVNNLYNVQPAASPDSTGFLSSSSSSAPSMGPQGFSVSNSVLACNDGRLHRQQQQHCGVVNNHSVGSAGGVIMPQPASEFSGYMQTDNFSLVADTYSQGGSGGMLAPSDYHQLPLPSGNFSASPSNNDVSMITTTTTDFTTSGVSSTAVAALGNEIADYNMNDFASNIMNNMYSSPLFTAPADDCSSAHSMIFQQSSQCY